MSWLSIFKGVSPLTLSKTVRGLMDQKHQGIPFVDRRCKYCFVEREHVRRVRIRPHRERNRVRAGREFRVVVKQTMGKGRGGINSLAIQRDGVRAVCVAVKIYSSP